MEPLVYLSLGPVLKYLAIFYTKFPPLPPPTPPPTPVFEKEKYGSTRSLFESFSPTKTMEMP